jgi:hypothetical protein
MTGRYEEINKFALDYNSLQLLLLSSGIMKIEYQRALSRAIDIMQIYGKDHHKLIFDGDKINWEASFPENYHGNGSDTKEWLEKHNRGLK